MKAFYTICFALLRLARSVIVLERSSGLEKISVEQTLAGLVHCRKLSFREFSS